MGNKFYNKEFSYINTNFSDYALKSVYLIYSYFNLFYFTVQYLITSFNQ